MSVFGVPSGNYVDMLGYGDNEGMKEYLRLYIALHGDHEGGNVSAHTARKSSNCSSISIPGYRLTPRNPKMVNLISFTQPGITNPPTAFFGRLILNLS